MLADAQVIVVGGGLPSLAVARALAMEGIPVSLITERDANWAAPIARTDWYSAWRPGDDAAALEFATEGIDRLEALWVDSGGAFRLDRRGQLLVAERPETAAALRTAAGRHAALGGGPLREHVGPDWYLPSPRAGFRGVPGGLDLVESGAVATLFPFLTAKALLAVQVRRAGVVDVWGLGRWLMASLRLEGGQVVDELAARVEATGNDAWSVTLGTGETLRGRAVVFGGPSARIHAGRTGWDLAWADCSRLVGCLGNAAHLLQPAGSLVVGLDHPSPQSAVWGPSELLSGMGVGVPIAAPSAAGCLKLEALIPSSHSAGNGQATVAAEVVSAAEAVLPCLATHRGPPGNLALTTARVSLVPDLQPVVGMADPRGGYLLTGLAAGVTHLLAAADLMVRYLTEEPGSPLVASIAPDRLMPAREPSPRPG